MAEKSPRDTGAPGPESEITPAMIEAGIDAAELESYEWGWGEEEALVKRVFEAMRKAELFHGFSTPCGLTHGKHNSP